MTRIMLVFAFGEALAHLNAMIRDERLRVANAAKGPRSRGGVTGKAAAGRSKIVI